jgi:hypothetical protein
MRRFHVGVLGLVMVILLGACAVTHAVRCDSKLEPINPPHVKAVAEAGK